jgi:ribosomal protein S12 methylthiotransferase
MPLAVMVEGKVPYLDIPFRTPAPRAQRMRCPAHAVDTPHAFKRGAGTARSSRCAESSSVSRRDPRRARELSLADEAGLIASAASVLPVEGASANALPDPVPEAVKDERHARFMQRARKISSARLAAKVGQRLRVLIDRIDDGVAVARGPGDAPEIDGVVRIARAAKLKLGEFADVEITGADAYDLEARLAPTG